MKKKAERKEGGKGGGVRPVTKDCLNSEAPPEESKAPIAVRGMAPFDATFIYKPFLSSIIKIVNPLVVNRKRNKMPGLV